MATSYPAAIDNFTNPTATDFLNSVTVPHDQQHANLNDAVEAIETELGTNPKGSFTSVADRIANDTSASLQALSQREISVGDGLSTTGGSLAEDPTFSVSFGGSGSATTVSRSDHTHAATDIISGALSVSHGGTGLSSLTSGSYLRGNGSSDVSLVTPASVLTDIGAQAAQTSFSNFNSIVTTGAYYSSTTTPLNRPGISQYYVGTVYNHPSSGLVQRFLGLTDGIWYRRIQSSLGVWGAWWYDVATPTIMNNSGSYSTTSGTWLEMTSNWSTTSEGVVKVNNESQGKVTIAISGNYFFNGCCQFGNSPNGRRFYGIAAAGGGASPTTQQRILQVTTVSSAWFMNQTIGPFPLDAGTYDIWAMQDSGSNQTLSIAQFAIWPAI